MSVLVQPLITEKLTRLQEEHQQYAFEVDRNASKPEIRRAIEDKYPDVKVARVNTMIMPSKPKGRYTKSGFVQGRSKVWKKAIITLKEGEIDFFAEI
ncbi:50S ribosomal protein L23 [Rhodohalobacter sulfatireducens]|jgi:large subunit ribosomal protein L23|uniref:Large ribosomal subunit protein uL23 n=1 Tax=Rhodohalobacter sulfatireducens TaxID=2911366 RepID=A0ABS9KJL7_9BACT|nr:50S ribosomal protein L23 [Rhodohalobacter sulfatireducens]MCG2590992.1 50S ribosomal protein L23 [Rhodohalobacter sulfatireducens]MDR9366459.1 50S ribosomal protein L23 [Balneolaceae bacterium]MDR9409056.1 50S ribosomal protein L23 [Balneolaceae bacterium]NBC04170.1 50S ribosomal protein L23 [Bacteroidota bacterium]